MSARSAAARGAFTCPACGKPNDAATAADLSGVVPGPGDVLVCIGCAEPAIVAPDGASLLTAPQDVRDDPDVRRVAQLIAACSCLQPPEPQP